MSGRLVSRRPWRESRCGWLDAAVDKAMEVKPRSGVSPGQTRPHGASSQPLGVGGRVVHQCGALQAHSLLGRRVRGREESRSLPV